MATIKRINQFHLARTFAICYGIPFGGIALLIGLASIFVSPGAFIMSVVMAAIYPFMMFAAVWCLGWIYNFTLPWTGGIEIELN
jgi:hypothetical protein